MYDVVNGAGYIRVSYYIISVVLGKFAQHLKISLREIHIFVTLTLNFKFNGGRIGTQGTGQGVIFYPIGLF